MEKRTVRLAAACLVAGQHYAKGDEVEVEHDDYMSLAAANRIAPPIARKAKPASKPKGNSQGNNPPGPPELPEDLRDPGTVEELKAALDHLQVGYPPDAKKADLVELFEEHAPDDSEQ